MQKYKQDPSLPPELLDKILDKIHRAELKQLRRRVLMFSAGILLSLGYVKLNWENFAAEKNTSSFLSFVNLAITDPDVIFLSAKDYLIALLESLPIATLTLAITGILLISVIALFIKTVRELMRTRLIR